MVESYAPVFSIVIPSWNNLTYLQKCVESIRKNSEYKHQIIVHINEGNDGTRDWCNQNAIDHTFSEENIGICKGVNQAARLASADFIVYMNDDMYVLPQWDKHLYQEAKSFGYRLFMLSATMIEPKETGNPVVIVADHGTNLNSFREEELLEANHTRTDWQGASWPPVLVHRGAWELVGGFSEAFSPGMYSDPDLAMKLWQEGCRIFKGVGRSQVYHFMCKSTGRVTHNPGRKQFTKKWGLTPSAFYKHYLRMGQPFTQPLPEPQDNSLALQGEKLKANIIKTIS